MSLLNVTHTFGGAKINPWKKGQSLTCREKEVLHIIATNDSLWFGSELLLLSEVHTTASIHHPYHLPPGPRKIHQYTLSTPFTCHLIDLQRTDTKDRY